MANQGGVAAQLVPNTICVNCGNDLTLPDAAYRGYCSKRQCLTHDCPSCGTTYLVSEEGIKPVNGPTPTKFNLFKIESSITEPVTNYLPNAAE